MSDLTLIIPAKNEKESLPKVLDELKEFDFKKNVILEASDRLTIEAIKTYDCKIIYQDSNGYGDALKKGIETIETEFFCIFNADGSFDEKDLKKMLELNKNYDFIFASRYLKGGGSDDDTVVTYIGNKIFSFLVRQLSSNFLYHQHAIFHQHQINNHLFYNLEIHVYQKLAVSFLPY